MADMNLAIDKLAEAYSEIKAIVDYVNTVVGMTMDYTAVYSSYQASFERLAGNWSKDWAKYGYESAEAYENSFVERMNESLAGLSGIQVDEAEGLLTETGLKNLGLNIREVTQYASQLASTANSVGLAGEVSLAAAQSFTRLAGDMASLFQVDYGTAAESLQSGLLGQSEALNLYGINLGEAALQAYAYELGLEKTVAEMSQMESMQLRMLAILDQSRMSWGNLADTINMPANLMRQFTNNMEETGMVLGQLFIPLLQKILPVVNGAAIAIKQLLINIAGLLGVNIDFGSLEQGTSGYGEQLEEVSDGLDSVTSSAKRAKAGLRAFDELKVINMTDTSTGAVSGGAGGSIDLTDEILNAAKEYEKVWDEAYAAMESRAQEFANKISHFLEPIQTIFEDFTIGDFFKAGQDVSGLVSGIFNFFAEAIDKVDWYGIGQKMGDFLAGIDWTAILKSIGNLIWQALKASLELFAGMFDTAPVETFLLSILAISTAIDLLKASKLGTLAKNIGLVVSAMSGNQDANLALSKSYPKLKAAVDVARKAFANFRFGIENGNFLTGLNAGIDTVRSNLTGMQKGIIGVVAVFGEFALLKDAFHDIASGSDNLVASIGKIVIGAGAASAALYVAFGPAGLVVAGLTALVAGFMGVKSAMEDLVDENIGNSIRDAFMVPGGTPIESIAEKFKNVVGEVGDSFSKINEKSASMEATKDNITDVWTEIEKIKLQMDAGVISVEEGTEKLTQLFGELATQTQSYFGDINSALVVAFGENGAYRQYGETVGVDVSNALLTALGITGDMQEEAFKLIELMSNPNISTEDYIQYQTELNKILGITDDLSIALSNFESQLSNLTDYSLFFDVETGELNTNELEKVYSDITTLIQNTDAEIEQSGNALLADLEEIYGRASSDKEREYIQGLMDSITVGMESAKDDIRQQAMEITDMMQQDFIGMVSGIIEDAEKEWENFNGLEKWWMNVTGIAEGKADYVDQAILRQRENIDKLSDATETMFAQLGVDGAGWAKDTMDEIYTAIRPGADVSGLVAITINSDFKTIIDNALSEMPGYTEQYGKDAAQGYADGITASSNVGIVIGAVTGLVTGAMEEWQKAQDSNSPSEVTKGFGKDAVDGYNLGIIENGPSTLDTVASYMNAVKNEFLDFVEVFVDVGNQIMSGLLNGMSSVESSLYDKAQTIADNITNTVRTALDIHSPSRVMFQVGDFTMEGMEEGMESRYPSILSSLKGFSADLQFAPVPTVAGMLGDYQKYDYNSALSSSYEPAVGCGGLYSQNNAEANALLRELLTAVRQGQKIEIDGRELGRTVQEVANDHFYRTGRPYFAG